MTSLNIKMNTKGKKYKRKKNMVHENKNETKEEK